MMTIPAEPGSLLLLKRSNVDSLQVKDGEELLLPAHEEFIVDLDKKKRILKVNIPEGLLE